MKKKIVWLMVSCLMVAALLLASCGPAAEEGEEAVAPPTEEEAALPVEEEEVVPEGAEMVKVRLTKLDGTTVEKLVEKPRYGGVLKMGWFDEARSFDQMVSAHPWWCHTVFLTHEELLIGDWALGPAGTGDLSWAYLVFPEVEWLKPTIAEDWEMPDETTIIYHIRKGVHFHNKPPTNGREVTADDVAFSISRLWFPKPSNVFASAAHLVSVEATDKYTVVVKLEPEQMGSIYRHTAFYPAVVPRDAVEEFGDMSDWRNSIGTGPFMLVDFVSGSSATFVRNPNYWQKDPVHPENQLPYLDGVKYLVIPDQSTMLAALRTAKIDWVNPIGWEDARSLKERTPELKYLKAWSALPTCIAWRVDKPELPFYDVKVRQALWMAVNHEELARDFYGGEADVYAFPILNIPEFKDFDIPREEWSDTVKMMFEYHPDKAKQLLAEAGYPDGFETTIICSQYSVDLLSVIKEYWAKVGVELNIDSKEYGAFIGQTYGRKYDITTWSTDACGPQFVSRYRTEHNDNAVRVSDAYLDQQYEEISANFFNLARKAEIYRENHPYMREQAYYLGLPAPASYTFWWPWVKNYHGEYAVGTWCNRLSFPTWAWLDQDLKEEMTGRR